MTANLCLASALLTGTLLLSGCAQIEHQYAAFFGDEPTVEEKAQPDAALEKPAAVRQPAPIVIDQKRPLLSQRFKVFQTLENGALANLCEPGDERRCQGMIVYIESRVDAMLYDQKTVFVTNPVVVGTWKYTDRDGLQHTVPVVSDRQFHLGREVEALQ